MLTPTILTGEPVVIEPSELGFFLYTTNIENCELPRDYIYLPFGYFDWVGNASTGRIIDLFLMVLTVFIALLLTWIK